MFNQREFNSDRPRSNFRSQRAKDHPAQLPLVRSGPPAPVKNRQYVPQAQRNLKINPELRSSGTGPGYAAELKTYVPPKEKIKYEHEFLLSFRFSSASLQKPDGLLFIPGVVLDKPNQSSSPFLDSTLQKKKSHKEPCRVLPDVFQEDVQLNQAANAWRPGLKKASERAEEKKDDPEAKKTQEMLGCFRSILNKLTPQMFDRLIQRVNELAIDSEERLKGVIDLVFEKAIREPHFSETYAKMCHCLVDLKVPTSDNPAVTAEFRTLLLRCCQKEFQKNKDDDEIIAAKRKQLDAATETEERQRLKEELEQAENKARRRSLGNIKLIGELFKLKMLADSIIHKCIAKLLNDNAEESLECLSKLLSTIGKGIDERDKTLMDQYVIKIDNIIRARKSSTRIRFMLQDVLDLRRNKWVPRRADLGPKMIAQIHEEAKLENQEQVKQQFWPKRDWTCGPKNTNITKPEERRKYSLVFTQIPQAVKQSTEGPVGIPKIPDIEVEEAVPETPSVPESAPSALELKEEITTEAEDELPEEAITPVIQEVDQTPLTAPVDLTVTVEPEAIEETVVYTDDVMPQPESLSVPESAPSALELMEEITTEAEDILPEETITPVIQEVDQTPPSAPVDLTVTVEPETIQETVVYTDDVMHQPESLSVPESAPSALELMEKITTEAEDILPEETITPVIQEVDQTPLTAPVDLTVTVEPEAIEETVVYTDDVMPDGVSSVPESNSTAPESSGIPYKTLISGGLILTGLCCSGLLIYHGAKWLLKGL
ncbi:uncharacterized protein LOC111191621 isoform X1 [Astyanax mexicanus]|uniref:uncharacterized protein LOC111191621 isoform X1 n=1 Tax=Astyanax mexicanus TaxID=7994 RepID=UPI0020CAA02D|nr:uncharacterized protein LOC111191621 isoform X1 [Astyanax mexicanus]